MAKKYVYETKWTTKNQVSRSFYGFPDKPTAITIHHWGNDGQRFENVCDWLSYNTLPTSAHYVVEDGRIACLASPERATFHAGSTPGNGSSVGIEMIPELGNGGALETLVQLVYELEKAYGSMRIYIHKEWQNTACPGRYEPLRAEIISRVNTMHANGGTDPGRAVASAPTPAPPVPAPAPAPTPVKAPPVVITPELDRKPVTDINGNVRTLKDVLWFRFNKYEKGLTRLATVEAEVKALRTELNTIKKAG